MALFAQSLHIPPDVAPVQGPSVLRDKHRSGGDFLFLEIDTEQAAQLVREKSGAVLAFVVYLGVPGPDGLHRDKAQLRHPDAHGANGLDDHRQTLVFVSFGVLHQPNILGAGQLLVLTQKQCLLDFQLPQSQLIQSAKGKKR